MVKEVKPIHSLYFLVAKNLNYVALTWYTYTHKYRHICIWMCFWICVCVYVSAWIQAWTYNIYTHTNISKSFYLQPKKKKKDLRDVWKDTSLISNSLGSLSNKRSEFKYYVVQIILRSLLHCHGYQASQIKPNSIGSFHCRCCLWKLNETRSARAEQKLHCWSRNKQRRAYAPKTPSPRGKGGQKLLRGKR